MDGNGRQRRGYRTDDHFVSENVGTRVARVGCVHDRVRSRVVRAEFPVDGSFCGKEKEYRPDEPPRQEPATSGRKSWPRTCDGISQTVLVPLHILFRDALGQEDDHRLIRGRANI